MRIATYTRISTDEEHQPYSLEAQDERLRSYIRSQEGWELTRQFTDQMTGSSLERPNLQRALAEARTHRYDLLLVYRVDRLSRSVRGFAEILHDLDLAGAVFRSATEPFDTGSPAGRMMVQMLGVFAEFERATIIDRVVAGMERKAARGGWNGGSVPFGYRFNRENGVLDIEPNEAALIPVIFDLYLNKRLGTRSIGTWLAQRGHRTRGGKPWNFKAVLTVLRNRVYLGEVCFRGSWHPAPQPTLIDAATFEATQALLEERGESHSRCATNSSDYVLAGLVVCAACGKHFVGTAAHGKLARYTYYTCFSRHRYGTPFCSAERLPAERLDDAVLQSLFDTYSNDRLIARAVAYAQARVKAAQPRHAEELAAVEAEIRKADEALDRYFQAFESGTMPDATCAPRVEALAEKLRGLKVRKGELQAAVDDEEQVQAPAPAELAQLRALIGDVMKVGPAAQRKAVVQELVVEVRVESREAILPVFRLPSAGVRPLSQLVRLEGIEPPALRSGA